MSVQRARTYELRRYPVATSLALRRRAPTAHDWSAVPPLEARADPVLARRVSAARRRVLAAAEVAREKPRAYPGSAVSAEASLRLWSDRAPHEEIQQFAVRDAERGVSDARVTAVADAFANFDSDDVMAELDVRDATLDDGGRVCARAFPEDRIALEARVRELLEGTPKFVTNDAPEHSFSKGGFVPAGHGRGRRYDWAMQSIESLEMLMAKVTSVAAKGWRLGYITTDGLPFPEWPSFEVMWLRDDDSNYLTGVEFCLHGDLQLTEDWLRTKKRRPIAILHTGIAKDDGFFVIPWIMDRLGPEDWVIMHLDPHAIEEGAEDFPTGFRPVWATRHSSLTVLLLRDEMQGEWWIKLRDAASPAYDPIEDYLTTPGNKGRVPVCLECKVSGQGGLVVGVLECRWTVLGVYDLDAITQGIDWVWDHDATSLPSKTKQIQWKASKWRVPAFARYAVASGDAVGGLFADDPELHPRWAIVRSPCPTPVLRSNWVPGGGPFPLPLFPPGNPMGPSLQQVLEDLVTAFMAQNDVDALTLAIRDATGWRWRIAYTYAPWAQRETEPESQFRIGSVSKVLTSIGLMRAVEENPNKYGDPATFMGLRLVDVQPWPMAFPQTGQQDQYPSTVNNVTMQTLFQHVAGWSQRFDVNGVGFDPGLRSSDILAALSFAPDVRGWRRLDDVAIPPIVRMDQLYYMMNAYVWSLLAPASSAQNQLRARTGWRQGVLPNTVYDPANPSGVNAFESLLNPAYSGFGYTMLATVLESVADMASAWDKPRIGFEGYESWVTDHILQHAAIGAKGTVPGRTPRYAAGDAEAVYPAASSVDTTGVAVNPFAQTSLYLWTDDPDIALAYALDPPWEIDVSPRSATPPYGTMRFSTEVPGGGWVSTAPDLCRILGVLYPIETAILTQSTVDLMVAGGPAMINGFTPGGLGAQGFTRRFNGYFAGSSASVHMRLSPTRLRLGHCRTDPDGLGGDFGAIVWQQLIAYGM